MLALKHCAKRVSLDTFSWASAFRIRLAMAESESNKETFGHLFFPISHALKGLLFIMDFLVLGHVGFVGEVVKITSVGFRVELRHKWCLGFSQSVPINLGKVLVFENVGDV